MLVQASYLLVTWRDLGPEEQALRQQQQFMIHLSHELRTPLAILTGCLKRLSRLDALPERVVRAIRMSCEEVSRINRLLKTLTLAIQLEIGSPLQELVDASLLPLLEQWHLRLPDDQRRRVQLESCVASPDCRVLVDVNALHLVLDQLLDKELRDAPESMAITVGIDADDQNGRVTVSCHGLMALMERPNQGQSTDGADLELPVVRQLVEAWKGEVSCRWSSANDATCLSVVFTIPRIPSPGMQALGEVDKIDQA